ncbi:putative subunit of the heterodimeric FACT complex [Dioszegia hungarica]|uniref:FACT complex subunit POB3 n=1 Tax=Dioszegia hungarica TaxID=4972 RepID=A0AA38H393_9TREE|nr:putative subunit of the heterodimeric FACT complex [Dioszegia hungarica]KAI9633310.1 putative subunit of the heterodimeric FACT complex [Dioszegia hungarica]
MSTVTFENVFHGDSSDLGKLRFNAAGFGWKSYTSESAEPLTFSGGDVRAAAWMRVARGFQVRFGMRQAQGQGQGQGQGQEGGKVTFEGFKRDDLDKIKRTLDEFFSVKLEIRDISLKGWNWGELQVQGNDIQFQVQTRPTFEIPLSVISNSNIAGKNEVALEFTPVPITIAENDLKTRQPDELVEMRFYVPGKSTSSSKGQGQGQGQGRAKKEEGEEDEDEDEEEDEEEVELDEEGNEVTAAEALHRKISERADIGGNVGDNIVTFEEVLVLTPRGRFSIEFFLDSLRLVGKSTDYRLPFTSIHRIFLIPKVDDLHVQLVLGLDPPIRQGATRYPFLVAQWPKDEEVDAELNLEEEELEKYPGLSRKYESPTFQVISLVLKALTGKKITPPSSYRTAQGLSGVKANVKAVQGELYFLEKGLIFIAKQPILIDFSKTESISFSRVGGGVASARTFDMRVAPKSGGADHVFSAISKEEVDGISAFLGGKNVRLKNEMEEPDLGDVDMEEEVEGLSDEDMSDASIPSEDERGKGKGKGKGKGEKGRAEKPKKANDDDDESDDEDFHGSSSDGGSPSESSSNSDAGSDAGGGESDASDPMMEEIAKKAAAKKKAAKAAGAGAADEEGSKRKNKTTKTKKGSVSGSGSEAEERPKKKKSKKD